MVHGNGNFKELPMPNEYLIKEYELCFEQLRYYDNRSVDLFKYLFTLSSAVGTAQFAIFKFVKTPTAGFFGCQAFLTAVVFVVTLVLFLSLVQNRLYFVFIAKQINAIRSYFLKYEAVEFKENQLYTSTDFRAFKLLSVHTFQLFCAAFISSLFAGIACFSAYPAFGYKPNFKIALIVFLIILITETFAGFIYLLNSSDKSADEVIHRQ
jgi:hypothetical protein